MKTFEQIWAEKPGIHYELHIAEYWYSKGQKSALEDIQKMRLEIEHLRACLLDVERDAVYGMNGTVK